jgi:hypothetical protein
MPMYEHQGVKVTLVVEVDGHRLAFEQTGKATGARYHGADPQHGYDVTDTLEYCIRDAVTQAADRVVGRARTFLARAYPICTDNREDTK